MRRPRQPEFWPRRLAWGLTESFLGQLPEIRKRVAAGEATAAIDAAKGWFGVGGPGEVRRMIDSGADALLRNLTGAGMSASEAAEYARRYRLQPTDSAETVLSKLGQLERELHAVQQTVGRGRGGVPTVAPGASSTAAGTVVAPGAPAAPPPGNYTYDPATGKMVPR